MSKANDIQYGGDHYRKMAIQPWDFIDANDIPFLEGSAIAYIARWRSKGGVEDLRKAIHFLEKRIEIETGKNQLTSNTKQNP
jgi:UDP-3-O-acyl-N-acetylglucosamine deacetylase